MAWNDLQEGETVIWRGGPAPVQPHLCADPLGLWLAAVAVVMLFVSLFLREVVPVLAMAGFAIGAILRLLPVPLGRHGRPPDYVLTDRRAVIHEPAHGRTRTFALDTLTPRIETRGMGGTVWLAVLPEGPRVGGRLSVRQVPLGFIDVAAPGRVMDLIEDAQRGLRT